MYPFSMMDKTFTDISLNINMQSLHHLLLYLFPMINILFPAYLSAIFVNRYNSIFTNIIVQVLIRFPFLSIYILICSLKSIFNSLHHYYIHICWSIFFSFITYLIKLYFLPNVNYFLPLHKSHSVK